VHDNVRRFKGLWNKAVKSIGFLKAANIDVAVHTIISRHQYLNIGRLIQLCIEWGVSSLYICHVEADHENRHMLMSVEQIKEYSKDVLPGLIDLISSSGSIPDPNKPVIIEGLSTLFPSDDLEIEMYSQGRYGKYSGKSKNSDCLIPYYYSLILEDGSVLPCNAVEYTHDPKVGNILEDDFNKIWHSKAFNDFRKKRMEWCAVCPMMAHRIVPLTKLTNRSSDIFKQDAKEVR
jgi:MoaA/NifB/PqqE/SkfB family radical SAM enzyme